MQQSCYRGSLGSPKTKGSKRILPLSESLHEALVRFQRDSRTESDEELVFHAKSGKPYSDTNLLHRVLKPAGAQVGAPWLNWHTLRRTHCTLSQQAGGSLRDAQALGHSKMSTTLEIYTIPIDEKRRETVESLDRMVTNGDELARSLSGLKMPTQRIQ